MGVAATAGDSCVATVVSTGVVNSMTPAAQEEVSGLCSGAIFPLGSLAKETLGVNLELENS